MRLLKKVIQKIFLILPFWILLPVKVFGIETSGEVSQFTHDTLSIILTIAGVAEAFFLIKGGYGYMTSSGRPEKLESAKRTIRNAIAGLVLVIASVVLVSIFNTSLSSGTDTGTVDQIEVTQVETVSPSDGLTQILIDSVSAFMQNIIESATKPVVDGVLGYLTTTPSLMENKTVVNFWLVSLGIVDSLFVLTVALWGLKIMSGDTFGFEETSLKQVIPRVGLFFLLANVSLFLADYVIKLANVLVSTVLNSTGGLSHSWVVNMISGDNIFSGNAALVTLIFLLIFLVVAILLLFMFISRLILIAVIAVLSPFIFLLWASPKFSDLAEGAMRSYMVAVFMVFIQVVIIQLASAFLSLPEQSGNSLILIAVAVGLFLTLLKVPGTLNNMIFYVSGQRGFKKLGNQLINVVSSDHSSNISRQEAGQAVAIKKARRRVTI